MKNNITLQNIDKQECTGCSTCEAICPTEAIEMILTEDGFYEPKVNEEICIDCKLCTKVCYKYDKNILQSEEEKYKSYAAVNKNQQELRTATSGGVSVELMRAAIKEKYKVVGVAYDYINDRALTKIVDNEEEIEQFKGSKYFQSFTVDAFREIANDKSEQKYAIFGTPCQIYGISKLAEVKKNRHKYLFVDLFCHGCPSLNIWKKYLGRAKKDFKCDNFDNIEFRSKVHGWHEFAFKFKKGNLEFKNSKINDPFYELFFDMNTHNKACYECKMRSSFAYTDIRLGDFWGYQYDIDTKGVSAVIVTSAIGEKIFDSISEKIHIKSHSIEETIFAQSYGKEHKYDQNVRINTLNLINKENDINIILKKYRRNYSQKKKLKIYSKNLVKLLPKKVYFKIKKIMHSI